MNEIIQLIIDKKELQNINRDIVKRLINENLDKKIEKIISEKRFKTSIFRNFVKKIRAQLRRQYGAFQNPKIDRKELLKKKDYIALLKSHQSSKERLPYYEKIYEHFWKITGVPETILDLGCGMNPISFEFMKLKQLEYHAYDISKYDLGIIKSYFDNKKIKCVTKVFDATTDKYVFDKNFDVCFCFKLFEILETTKSHKLSEDIFLKIPCDFLIASFNTRTLGNKPMKRARRIWFEVMLERLGFKFNTLIIPNEIFYIINKQ